MHQDYHEAREIFKKACDMDSGMDSGRACLYLGALYGDGQGVRQNLSTAKQYLGKACDLGIQIGCDLYRDMSK